jgi:hypothetical protein
LRYKRTAHWDPSFSYLKLVVTGLRSNKLRIYLPVEPRLGLVKRESLIVSEIERRPLQSLGEKDEAVGIGK